MLKTLSPGGKKNNFNQKSDTYFDSIYFPASLIFIGSTLPIFFMPESTTMVDGTTIFANQKVALGIWKGWIVAPLIYLTLILNFLDKKDIKKSFHALIAAALALSIHGLYQWTTGTFITIDQRVSGPFISANYLSLFIGPALVYLILETINPVFDNSVWQKIKEFFQKLFASSKSKQQKKTNLLIRYVSIAIITIALLGSQSYGAILAVIGAIAFYLAIQTWRLQQKIAFNHIVKITGIAIAIIAASAFFFTFINPDKVDQLFVFNERTSSAVRIQVWTIASSLIKNNFLLGIGPGQFEIFYQLNAVKALGHTPYEWVMLHPHNLFLTFWLYSGILGFIGFLWMTVRAFLKAIENKSQNTGLILLMVFTAIFIHGIIDTPFWKNDLALIFWLTLGGFEIFTRKKA